MHKNLFWQAFLGVVFITTLWYSAIAFYSYYSYARLDAQVTPSSMKWEIEEKTAENYFLKAFYHYSVSGHSFEGDTTLDEPYRNQWAAEQVLKEFLKKQWSVWFDSQDPNYSSLQKKIPFKECISAALLWGLLLYFLWLGFYVTRFKK